MKKLRVAVGPERIVLTDGLQPFLFRGPKGTLFLQAQYTAPHDFVPPSKDMIPGGGWYGNVISRDGGKTWERYLPDAWKKRQLFFEGAYTQLRNGAILFIEWIARGPKGSGHFEIPIWVSKDDLKTMRGPIIGKLHMPQAKRGGFDDGGHPYSGLTFHRTVLEMPNGDLLASAYCWFKGDDTPCDYMPKMCKFPNVLLRSTDRGRNWKCVSTVAVDPKVGEEGFNENAMVRLSKGRHEGRLICLMRTGSQACPIYQTVSDDDGQTWSKPRALSFRGVDPDLIEMVDGTLACSFGWRVKNWTRSSPPANFGNYFVFSCDQGETWMDLTTLPIESNANTLWTTCYTTLCEIAPGRLFVVYDIGRWGMPVRYIGSREVSVL